jgi:hypothetical protein
MEIKNILTKENLQLRLDKLCEENWLIDQIYKATVLNVDSTGILKILGSWPKPTRKQLLKKLNVFENAEHPGIYHASSPEK